MGIFGGTLSTVAASAMLAGSVLPGAVETFDTVDVVAVSSDAADISVQWLSGGKTTQYPSTGGKWEYGFWDTRIRSYYTVNRCHGSTVALNGNQVRSANTSSGKTSVATKFALNYWGNDDQYWYRVC